MKKIKVKLLEIQENELPIKTEFIKLDSALKLSNIASTGGHAKILIEEERIKVNGEKCLVRGKKLFPGDNFEYRNQRFLIVSLNESK